ncbi:MAG: hypothetical protein WDZ83_11840 [Rhizobiaceae bacterium]
MSQHTAAVAETPGSTGSRFAMRIFYVCAALAMISVVISIAGKLLGGSIASVGHTEDTDVFEVVVGNNVLAVPANYIRFEKHRVDGDVGRLDLYMRWPDLAGYRNDIRDDFNHRDGSRRILFLSVDARLMSRDMSARLDPIYRRLIELPGMPLNNGLRAYRFAESSGYMNEMLVVGDRAGEPPFVARCLTGSVADGSLAACERDVDFGDDLSLTYRFPAGILGEWRKVDKAILEKMRGFLRTAP